MKKLWPILLVLLLLTGCAQKNRAEDVDETDETSSALTERQTTLETVSPDEAQEIVLPFEEETASTQTTNHSTTQTTAEETDAAKPETTAAQSTTAAQTASSAPTTTKADKETKKDTTTKPAMQQNTTTTKPAAPQSTAKT